MYLFQTCTYGPFEVTTSILGCDVQIWSGQSGLPDGDRDAFFIFVPFVEKKDKIRFKFMELRNQITLSSIDMAEACV